MKKNVMRIMTGVLAALMLFALVACAAPSGKDAPLTEEEVAVKEYADIIMALLAEEVEDETAIMEVEARGTELVYKYTYKAIDNLSDEDFAAAKVALDAELEAQAETLRAGFEETKLEEPCVTAVVFEYCEKSGRVITSFELK